MNFGAQNIGHDTCALLKKSTEFFMFSFTQVTRMAVAKIAYSLICVIKVITVFHLL